MLKVLLAVQKNGQNDDVHLLKFSRRERSQQPKATTQQNNMKVV